MPEDDNNAPVLVALARMEGKIDIVTEQVKGLKDDRADHELRIRALEAAPKPMTGRTLWGAMVGVATTAASLASVIYYASGK